MSYVTPPTFVDGVVLSASQLNILADDIAYLAGFGQRVNIPFTEFSTGSIESAFWRLKYTQRYLHYAYTCSNASVNDIKLHYDGNTLLHDGSPNMGTTTGFIDLQVDAPTIVPFGTYELEAEIDGGGGTLTVRYLLLASSDTL